MINRFWMKYLVFSLMFLSTSAYSQKNKGPKLPIFHQVGILPMQWTGPNTSGLEHVKDELDNIFPEVVRSSKRFRVVNDDLVASLWESPQGREELKSQFELAALIGLTTIARSDSVKFVARVLGPELQTYLLETETMSRNWVMQATSDELRDRLENLVFRVFNRIPIDVSVTSVQGPYITLSGGKEQGIEIGDNVQLVRSHIKSLHPANGTWLHYDTVPLGKAKIVESKQYTSVAKLVDLVYENAVEVADGARISAIASRVKFARNKSYQVLEDSGSQKTIIVPPLYQNGGELASPQNDNQVAIQKPTSGEIQAPDEERPNETPTPTPTPTPAATASPSGPLSPEDEAFAWDDFSMENAAKKFIDDVTVEIGPYIWSVTGPRSLRVNFPWWLGNRAYFSLTKSAAMKIKIGYGGGLIFGGTPNGKYFGYDAHARIYWEDTLTTGIAIIDWWRAGGHGRLNGMSVENEKFGGGDWAKGGVFGAIGGRVALGSSAGHYDWYGEFGLTPLNIGRLGYDEKFYQVESSLGQRYILGATQYAPPGSVRYGGKIQIDNERQTLSNGRRMHFQEYSLQMLMQFDM